MPKGPKLNDKDREMIAVIYNKNKSTKAEVIRQLASERLGRELGLSTVQREIANLRRDKSRVSTNPLDDQWSLASLKQYPVDSHVLPFLLIIQETMEENVEDVVKQAIKERGRKPPFLTIRLALWITRLFPLIVTHSAYLKDKRPMVPKPLYPDKYQWSEWLDDLVSISIFYANYENACDLKGISPVNTVNFDAPDLEIMKANIARYSWESWYKKGWTIDDPDLWEKIKKQDIRDIAPEGGNK